MRRASALFLLAGVSTITMLDGCTTPATEVLVVFDSDAPIERALTISAVVQAGSGNSGSGEVHRWTRGGASGSITLPASFAVVPVENGARDAPVTVTFNADLAQGALNEPAEHFRRRAQFSLVPGTPSLVRIFLRRACSGISTGCTMMHTDGCTVASRCEEIGQTCGDDAQCVDPMVVVEPGLDAGVAMEDARDAPTIDAVDASQADAVDAIADVPPVSYCTAMTQRYAFGPYMAGAMLRVTTSGHRPDTTDLISFTTGPSGSEGSITVTSAGTGHPIFIAIAETPCGPPFDRAVAGPSVNPHIGFGVGPGPGGFTLLSPDSVYYLQLRTLETLVPAVDSCPVGAVCDATVTLVF